MVSTGLAVPGILPLGVIGSLGGVTVPGITPVSSALLVNPLVVSSSGLSQAVLPHLIPQHTAAMVPKVTLVRYLSGFSFQCDGFRCLHYFGI